MIGLGSSVSADALSFESGLLASLLPAGDAGDDAGDDAGVAGIDALAQANDEEVSLVESQLAAQAAVYDPGGNLFGGVTQPDLPGLSEPPELSALSEFAEPGGGTLLADEELLGGSSVDLFA